METSPSRIIGTGEMADRVRAYPWSATPLGPIESWSRELVTIVNLTLASSSPARTMWGPSLILIYNDAYRAIPGPRHPFALGKPAHEVYSESWHVVGPLLEEALATGKTVFYEKLLVPLPIATGVREAYLNYSFSPIFEDGSIAGLFGTLHDVTGEVIALRKLAELEARASRILQSIGDAVIVTDEIAQITNMNHIAETLTGWTLDQARGQTLSTVFHIVDEHLRQPVESPADKVRRLGTIVGLTNHTLLIRRDGTETPIDDSGAPIWDEHGKLTGIVLVFRDITGRKLAEKATLQARIKAFEALQQAPVFFALLQGPDHVFTVVNPLYMRLVNHRDILNKPVRVAIPEAISQGWVAVLDTVFQGQPFVGSGIRFDINRGEGSAADERYLDFVYQPLREADGSVSGVIVVGNDVTDRKHAQDAIYRLAAIVDSSNDAIVSKSLDGIITSWNAAASRLLGYAPEEMIGQSVLKLIPEDLQAEETRIIESVRAGRRVEHFDTLRLNKNGSTVEVSLTVSPIRDDQGRVIGASKILHDVSDRKRIERALLASGKDRSHRADGCHDCHEINNPLEAVMNLLYLLRSKIQDQEGQAYLTTAEGELARVAHIAKQTLGYYREHTAATAASLGQIAEHAVAIYEPRCSAANIRIVSSFNSSAKPFLRRGEMMQVISNLIANSIYAMPAGGKLILAVDDTDQPRRGTFLTVTDTGMGIAAHDLPKVFDAFFTTRSTVGTGIGLFVAKQFIEGHGGEIRITSETDATHHGTTVRIFVPEQTTYAVVSGA